MAGCSRRMPSEYAGPRRSHRTHDARAGRRTPTAGPTVTGRRSADGAGQSAGVVPCRPPARRSAAVLAVDGHRDRAVGGLHPHRRCGLDRLGLADRQVALEDDRRRRRRGPRRGRHRWRRVEHDRDRRDGRPALPCGPPEPLRTGAAPRSSVGASMTRRAIDQASTSAITAATSTDQFGPPRVPRIEPLAPVASSASKTRRGSIGRVGVPLVVRREQRRRRRRRAPGPGCAGGRGRRSRRRTARSRRPRSTRSRAGGSGCARPAGRRSGRAGCARRASSGPTTGSAAGSTAKSSMTSGVDGVAAPGDRAHPVAPDLGVLDQARRCPARRSSRPSRSVSSTSAGRGGTSLRVDRRSLAQRAPGSALADERVDVAASESAATSSSTSSSSARHRRPSSARRQRRSRRRQQAAMRAIARRRSSGRGSRSGRPSLGRLVGSSSVVGRSSAGSALGRARRPRRRPGSSDRLDRDSPGRCGRQRRQGRGRGRRRRRRRGSRGRAAARTARRTAGVDDRAWRRAGGVELGEQALGVVRHDDQAAVAQEAAARRVLDARRPRPTGSPRQVRPSRTRTPWASATSSGVRASTKRAASSRRRAAP